MPRPRVHNEDLRSLLLEHAGRMVTEQGVAALSLRVLAAEAGTSTTAVYSLFGGKPALLAALYEESFESFGAAQRAVPMTGEVIRDLAALGQAYWSWARSHPHLYSVMFSQVLDGVDRTPEQLAMADSTIEQLSTAVTMAVRSGVLVGDPAVIAFSIWAAVHGVVSLALSGCAPQGDGVIESLFQATAKAIVAGWRPLPTPISPAGRP